MIQYTLAATNPGSEDYDENFPTKQTELLCLDLRKILNGLNGFVVTLPETDDLSVIETTLNNLYESFTDAEDSAVSALEDGLPVPLPELPADLISSISGLVLSGVVSPVAAIALKICLPIVGRVIARKMGVPGYSGEQEIDLSVIADRIAFPAQEGSEQQDLWHIVNDLRTSFDYFRDQFDEVFRDDTCSVFNTKTEEGENYSFLSVFHGLTALGERLSAFTRIVEELQSIMESKAVSIMHTSESDKVVYVTD